MSPTSCGVWQHISARNIIPTYVLMHQGQASDIQQLLVTPGVPFVLYVFSRSPCKDLGVIGPCVQLLRPNTVCTSIHRLHMAL